MKTIWLIWWMSWESSLEYYRLINEQIKEKLWWLHSAKILMYSVDFDEIEKLQHQWNWKELTRLIIDAAKKLEKWGADFILICTNTMHKVAEDVQNNINIPLIHIADATAEKIKNKWLKKIGLLWTKFTMEEDFYKWILEKKYNFDVIIPNNKDRQCIHDIIYNELCLGKINKYSKDKYIEIINKLVKEWAEWIILGCTEIPLLIKQEDINILLFDTTSIHAESASDLALK